MNSRDMNLLRVLENKRSSNPPHASLFVIIGVIRITPSPLFLVFPMPKLQGQIYNLIIVEKK